MTEAVDVVVPPSVSRVLATTSLGALGMVGGLFLIFGPGSVLLAGVTGVGGLAVLAVVVAVVRRRPRVAITPAGFTVHKLFGDDARAWEDVQGPFAVIRLGLGRAVGYRLTAEYKARTGRRPTTQFSGYDAAIAGAFALPADKLAELLNAHQRAVTGTANGMGEIGRPAEPRAAPDAGQ
jgi:hypothetical protein